MPGLRGGKCLYLLLVVAQNGGGQIAQVQLERHLARELLHLFGLIAVRVGVVVLVMFDIIALGFLLVRRRLLVLQILQVFAGFSFAEQSLSAGQFLKGGREEREEKISRELKKLWGRKDKLQNFKDNLSQLSINYQLLKRRKRKWKSCSCGKEKKPQNSLKNH